LTHVFSRVVIGLKLTVLGDSFHRVLAGAVCHNGEELRGIFPAALMYFLFADVTSDDGRFHDLRG